MLERGWVLAPSEMQMATDIITILGGAWVLGAFA